MKKLTTILLLAFGSSTLFAQDLTSKKGEPILPEADDWALGIEASPFLNYFGNLLNGATSNSSPVWAYPNSPWAITVKMFKDEKTAYRGYVRVGFGSTTKTSYQYDDTYTGTGVPPYVSDTWKQSGSNITIGGGLEMRRGKTRLQGFYGGMLLINLASQKNTYTYGNAITSTNTAPTRTDFGPNGISSTNNLGGGAWLTQDNAGSTFGVWLRGFIGAEYFIFSKVSVGAEFGWGLGMQNTGDGTNKSEVWDAINNNVMTIDGKSGGKKMFGLDTDINGAQMVPTGQLMMTLHF